MTEEQYETYLDGWKIFGIIIIIAAILVGGWFGYKYLEKQTYNKGVTAGQISVINSIQTTGYIPYFENDANNKTQLKQILIKDLCSGVK